MYHAKDRKCCYCIMPKTKTVAKVSCQRQIMLLLHHDKVNVASASGKKTKENVLMHRAKDQHCC